MKSRAWACPRGVINTTRSLVVSSLGFCNEPPPVPPPFPLRPRSLRPAMGPLKKNVLAGGAAAAKADGPARPRVCRRARPAPGRESAAAPAAAAFPPSPLRRGPPPPAAAPRAGWCQAGRPRSVVRGRRVVVGGRGGGRRRAGPARQRRRRRGWAVPGALTSLPSLLPSLSAPPSAQRCGEAALFVPRGEGSFSAPGAERRARSRTATCAAPSRMRRARLQQQPPRSQRRVAAAGSAALSAPARPPAVAGRGAKRQHRRDLRH